MSTWRTRIEPFTRPLFFAFARLSRGMTLGVRGVAVDGEGRVLLVKHTYVHGWWLPGGGVERGQTAEEALMREMREEAGLIVERRPVLVSAHSNERYFRGDHVLVYRVDAWRPGGLLGQAPALFVFFVAGLAEIRRPPFDMPIADSELVFGYMTEYTGLRFAFFLLAEYVGIVVIAALTTVLFLGGWKGPFLDAELGWLWTLIKVAAVSFVVIWLRVAYPRLREDQLQRLCWLVLVPLALAQLVLTVTVKVAL